LDLADRFNRRVMLIRDTLLPPKWLADGDRLVFWSEEGKDGGTWRVAHARTGVVKPLVPAAELRAWLAKQVVKPVSGPRMSPFAISQDSRSLVLGQEGKAFALGLEDGRLSVFAPEDRAALALSRSHFLAPKGGALAEQREGGFTVRSAEGRTVVERGGEEHVGWRIPENPWSPDGRFLVVWREDLRGVHKVPVVDYSTALERVTWVPYAKSGTPLPRTELHVVEVATGRVTAIAPVEGETYDWFVGWRPDGGEALCLHLSRDAKRLDLTAVEPGPGKRRRVLREERPETFVAGLDLADGGWAKQVRFLPDGKGFLWMSERDGWRHVYLYDVSGRLVR
jgi:hypothetical protein